MLPELPKSAKTFLGTSKACYHHQQFDNDGNEFVYFGMSVYLQSVINSNFHTNAVIHLIINVDELQYSNLIQDNSGLFCAKFTRIVMFMSRLLRLSIRGKINLMI